MFVLFCRQFPSYGLSANLDFDVPKYKEIKEMKKHLLHIAATLTILATLGLTASAQVTRKMTVTVPFDFYVGTTALPAGTYTVYGTSSPSGNGFLLADADGKRKVFFIAQTVQSGKPRSIARIDFNRYDDKYFLARIWSAENNIGRELQQSKLERDTAKSADRNVARKVSKPEFVTITSE
jgi:hypothetical protein